MTPNNEAIEAVKSAIDAACGRAGFKLRPHALSDFATAALTAALPLIRAQVLEDAAKALEADAKLCDCYAREESECGCGAWNDYKTVPMERAVALVRAVKENHP